MSVRELEHLIGKQIMVRAAEFAVPAVVLDVKRSYGRIRYRVVARSGATGEVWIQDDRIISGLEDNDGITTDQPAGHALV